MVVVRELAAEELNHIYPPVIILYFIYIVFDIREQVFLAYYRKLVPFFLRFK